MGSGNWEFDKETTTQSKSRQRPKVTYGSSMQWEKFGTGLQLINMYQKWKRDTAFSCINKNLTISSEYQNIQYCKILSKCTHRAEKLSVTVKLIMLTLKSMESILICILSYKEYKYAIDIKFSKIRVSMPLIYDKILIK